VACDVRLPFVEAAEVFGPQKGASPAQVELLRRRLERLAQIYLEERGVDVTTLEGAGAAGGLAGGLAALGARLEPGFDLVADTVDLDERLEGCDLVVTGEGYLDEQSFDGKVVGGVVALAAELGVPVLVVAGEVIEDLPPGLDAVSLTERFGGERSRLDTLACIEEVVAERLRRS
jgi:glycerate kinase